MQPTTLCNLNCSYCYLPDRAVSQRMSLSVADVVAATVREWSRAHPVRVLWHGGEPLATGVPHFRALLARFGSGESHPVRHAVQTNATLIDRVWCELFATTPVEVGVSIDGPAPQNTARADRGGHDSTARTLRGIGLLREHGIDFGAIAVVSDPSPARAAALYEWFAQLGATSLGVNIEERKGVHHSVVDAGGQVAEFWAALAQAWAVDRRVRIREFDHAFGYFRDQLTGQARARAERPINPMPMITWDGHVVPISPDLAGFTAPRHGPFTVGTVHDAPLGELLARAPAVAWVAEALAGVSACRDSCDHFSYCRGGQAANKYFETGQLNSTETSYCRNSKIALMKGLIHHVEHAHS
ncbi:MAG: cyclophane-forming radical SAM peptide maturase AmcB [Pseudonocardiaceae bacterium]